MRADAEIPLKKRGRPKAFVPRPGRPAQLHAPTDCPTASVSSTPAPPDDGGSVERPEAKRPKEKRTDWSAPENVARLRDAVDNWDNKTGEWLSLNRDMSFCMYSRCVGIPMGTFYGYAQPNVAKRIQLGSRAGKPSLISSEAQNFAVDVLRRRDRGNEGMNNRDAAEMIHDLVPNLKLEQVTGALRKTIRPNHNDVLTNIVKAQASTSKRSQITVAQQYRWHCAVESALNLLTERNTGLTPDGKTFKEVAEHFVCGGDETCFLASAGEVTIIGDKGKKKHEVHAANSRVSTTVYRTGFASGQTGPTGFLPPGALLCTPHTHHRIVTLHVWCCLAGTRIKLGYSDEFVQRHGAEKGV